MPSDLLKGCGAVATKEYTCRAFTPEEEALLQAKIELRKIEQVKAVTDKYGAHGQAVFEKMTDEEICALYDEACNAAVKKFVENGCKQQ